MRVIYNTNYGRTILLSERIADQGVVIPAGFLIDIPNISQHSFPYLLTPERKLCIGKHARDISDGEHRKRKLLILFIVHSRADNFEHRKVIRETWGTIGNRFTELIFLLGNPRNSTLQKLIAKEHSIHVDILQEDFVEVYRNITLKNVMGLKWASIECFNAKYVVKSDDDVYINSKLLISSLIRTETPRKNLILCKIHFFKNVPREGKYAVAKSMYHPDFWPSFCFGGCWIMSIDVVTKLYRMSLQTRQIYLDDVYVTGILRTKLSIPIQYLPRAYRLFCHAKGNSTMVRQMWNDFRDERKGIMVQREEDTHIKLWSYCFT